MNIKKLSLPFIVIVLVINTILVLTMPFNLGYKSQIQLEIISEIKTILDTKFVEISDRTSADIVWINLFHTIPERDFVATLKLRSDPLYQSAFHYWYKQPRELPIFYNQNDPVLPLEQIQQTFLGSCIHMLAYENDVAETFNTGIRRKRLIVRCPMFVEDIIVGTIGLTIFDYPSVNLDQYAVTRYDILQSYVEEIKTLLFKE